MVKLPIVSKLIKIFKCNLNKNLNGIFKFLSKKSGQFKCEERKNSQETFDKLEAADFKM